MPGGQEGEPDAGRLTEGEREFLVVYPDAVRAIGCRMTVPAAGLDEQRDGLGVPGLGVEPLCVCTEPSGMVGQRKYCHPPESWHADGHGGEQGHVMPFVTPYLNW